MEGNARPANLQKEKPVDPGDITIEHGDDANDHSVFVSNSCN